MENLENSTQIFKDIGCGEKLTQQLLQTRKNNDTQKQLILLASHRRDLLDMLHKYQKYIDCLDYYVYYLKKCKGEF